MGKPRVTILYVALTLLLAYPLSFHPGSRALPGDPDTDLFMWTLAWDTHALVRTPLSLFDANIYHPQRLTLAYSENLIGSAFFAAPVLWLTDSPLLALNFVALLSVVLCGLGAYVLARRLGLGQPAAILCGLIFAFSPSRFFRIGQLHLTTVQWIPFCLAALHAYLESGRRRDLWLAAALFTLQALTSGHGAVFLLVAVLGLASYRVVLGQPLAITRRVRDLGVPGALLLLPSALILIPYRLVQVEVGLRRSLVDWAPNPGSFLASPARLQQYLLSFFPDARINEDALAFLFPGYLPILLAVVALGWRGVGRSSDPRAKLARHWRRIALLLEVVILASLAAAVAVSLWGPIRPRIGDTLPFSMRNAQRAWLWLAVVAMLRIVLVRRAPLDFSGRLRRGLESLRRWPDAHRRNAVAFYGLLTLVAVLLAAPQPIGIWPLVYWLPGMNFIRGPSRFMILATLSLAVLAAFGFERLTARLAPARRRGAATIVGALLLAEFAVVPLPSRAYGVDIPAVDRWLDGQPKPFVMAEVPVTTSERLQSTYMLHSMAHWQKTIHGYSGIRAPLHEELYAQLRSFPDEPSLQALARVGVDWIVVHTDWYGPDEWERAEERLGSYPGWLTLAHDDGTGRVYALKRQPPGLEP